MSSEPRAFLIVVVTYNPGAPLRQNLEALRAQGDVIVIDNGSRRAAEVEAVARSAGCRWLANGTNLGLATALNLAANIARIDGFDWLATFDQDSLVPIGALSHLARVLERLPQPEDVAILSLCHLDAATGRDLGQPNWQVIEDTPDWRSVRSTITSGCLVRLSHLDQIGDFDDRLFVDSVDHEVCLRLRKAGYRVIESKESPMQHSIGGGTEHVFLGRRLVCTHHSAERHYYITRNLMELVWRARRFDPNWARHFAVHLVSGVVRVMLFEHQRPAKAAAMLSGVKDFALRRFGPRARRGA